MLILAARAYHSKPSQRLRVLARRFAAACILLVCRPRPLDTKLYKFCYPDNA